MLSTLATNLHQEKLATILETGKIKNRDYMIEKFHSEASMMWALALYLIEKLTPL